MTIEKMSKAELMVLIQKNGLFVEDPGLKVSSPQDIVAKFVEKAPKRTEHFFVATLDGSHKVIKVHNISKGTLNRALVHPRDVFYPAIKDNAAAIIISHNHPSGSTAFSNEDHEVTQRVKKAGEIMGIPVLDHIVVTIDGKYRSALENNEM